MNTHDVRSTGEAWHPHVSVVIVTFGREECVLSTLDSLLAQHYPSFDITVVDQNEQPVESIRKRAKALGGRLGILHLRPPGVVAARNIGVRAASGDIVLFVDDDIRCEPDLIEQHVLAYGASRIGGVAGWVDARDPKNRFQPQESSVETAFGCNMSYRRSVLLQVGGWDLRFHSVPAYGEEREISHRVRQAGYVIAPAPKALVFHDLSPSGGQRIGDPQDYWRSYTSNFVLLFRKTKSWPLQLLFPCWLLKLRYTVWKHSGGTALESTFWGGAMEGLRYARQSRGQTNFLAATPEALPIDPQ